MHMVLERLNVELEGWRLKRRLLITTSLLPKNKQEKRKKDMMEIRLKGMDDFDRPFMFLPKVEVDFAGAPSIFGKKPKTAEITEEDAHTALRPVKLSKEQKRTEKWTAPISLTLHFVGNYHEPPITLEHVAGPEPTSATYSLAFNYPTQEWEVVDEAEAKEAAAKKKHKKRKKKSNNKKQEDAANGGAEREGAGEEEKDKADEGEPSPKKGKKENKGEKEDKCRW